MKILILDDMHDRHHIISNMIEEENLFSGEEHLITSAFCFQDMRELLEINSFDVIFLDHDLENHTDDGMNGQNVAKLIARLPENKWPKHIVIHSHNPTGAKKMAMILERLVEKCSIVIKEFNKNWETKRLEDILNEI